MRLALVLLASAALVLPARARAQAADPCSGHWVGAIELPGAKLAFDVDFAKKPDGSCSADISIPAQNAKDIVLTGVTVTAAGTKFSIPGVPGNPTYDGAREANGRTISGTFTQGTGTFPFAMSLAAKPSELARATLEGFDKWVDSALVAWKVVGLSLGIVVDGEVVYLKGHGLRDREKHLPATPQTLFAIGSSSKAFTTFAMGALVDQGKLQWDVPVRTYLPWFRMKDDFATMHLSPRDLVTHRSGLPRHDLLWYNNQTATREELVRRIAHLPLSHELRETFQYNNLMFLTAGYLVGTINGSSWEDGLRQLVLTPLGMTRTNFSVKQSQADRDYSMPYRVRRDSIERIPFRDITLVGPAGAINSSAEEMLKWVTLHLNGGKLGDKPVIQQATLRDMYRPYTPIGGMGEDPELGPMSYGMGWFVDTYRGHYRAQHGGNIDGFTAAVQLLPHDKVGIVVLINQNGSALGELIARHALDRLFGATRRDWSREFLARSEASNRIGEAASAKKGEARVQNAPPAHPLATYVGSYADSGYGSLSITHERDTLVLDYHGIKTKLEPWHFETFSALRNPDDPTFESARLTFRTNAAGHVDGLFATMEAAVPAILFARQPDARLHDPVYLQRFTGRYQLPGGPVVVVTLRGNVLLWTQGSGAPTELGPEDGLRFTVKMQRNTTIEFQEDATGKVIRARAVQPGAVTDMPRIP